MAERPRQLRPDLPFRRIALVLSGGGALGAYEVGVFRALEAIGLHPAVIAGVSVGAMNAVVWVAHGFRSALLERAWKTLRGSSIGMRWMSLVLRAAGGFIAVLAVLEILLSLLGSPEFEMAMWLRRASGSRLEVATLVLETAAWAIVGFAGLAIAASAHQIEDTLAQAAHRAGPGRVQRWLGPALIAGAIVFAAVAWLEIPWPRRFHATLLVVGFVVWITNRPGRAREELRRLYLRLMPETGGRGLWRGHARRRLMRDLVRDGDGSRLVNGETHLIVSACAVDDGRMAYFVNWPHPSAAFCEDVRRALGDVVPLHTPGDVIEAVVAASAVPVLFEPARFRGRDYLDGGVFTNQPLHAVLADGADAVLMVLVSPSAGPRPLSAEPNLVELAGRLQELANWRDLQTELRRLPPDWSREGDPARVCVVEPPEPLPGWLFGFDPALVPDLVQRGERDAWAALERAGWLVEAEARPPGA